MGKGGGSGGGGGQSTSTSYQTNLPEYARPYVESMLQGTQKQLFQTKPTEGGGTEITGFQPYKAYGGTYDDQGNQISYDPSKAVAGFQPMQEDAQRGIANLRVPGQYDAASQAMMAGIGGAFDAGQYQAGRFGNQFRAPGQYNPNQFQTQDYTGQNVSQYMSPYMQNVVDVQQREAQRQSDIAGTQQAGQAVQAGAFGGSRAGLVEAERQRNLATQLGQIQATGSQAAFQNAQQQFNAQQQANMQAQQATEQSRQYGYGQGMNAAQMRAQYGLAGQQLGEQSRQFGANLGLQGSQAAMQGAGALAGIGGQQLQAQQGILGLQNQVGAQQQQLEQQKINQAMQDYANSQQYPLMQLGFMSNMLRGLPMQATTTQQYAAAPNYLTQGIGALGAGAGIYNAFKAEGGVIKEMAEGGITSVPSYDVGGEVYGDLMDMEPEQLEKEIKQSTSQRVRQMAQGILAEKKAQQQAPKAGIVAFTAGGTKDEGEIIRDPSVEGVAAEAGNVREEPAQPAAGILGAALPTAPVKPSAPAMGSAVQASDIPPVMKGIYAEAVQNAQKPVSDIMAEREEALKAMGVPDVAAGRAQQRSELMAERANAADESERQRSLRVAAVFAKMATMPGPTIVAAMKAFSDEVPNLINDQKEAKKLQRELGKNIADMDEADRLEKVGKVDKALAKKETALATLQRLNEDVYKFAQAREIAQIQGEKAENVANISAAANRYHTDTLERIEKLRADSTAAERRAIREGQADTKAFGQFQAATEMERRVLSNIAAQASAKDHQADEKIIETARMGATDDKGNFDPAKIPAPLRPGYEAATKRIKDREAEWDKQKEAATKNTELAYSRVRMKPTTATEQSGAGMATAEFPAPSSAHVAALKANPDQKAAFDAKFGPGAANEYLRK